MKRDWNEIRALLESIEQDRFSEYVGNNGRYFDSSLMTEAERQAKLEELGIERRDIILGHIELLIDAELVKGIKLDMFSGDCAVASLTNIRPRITMKGYDLLEYLRSPKFRNALNKYCANVGTGVTLDLIHYGIPAVLKMIGG